MRTTPRPLGDGIVLPGSTTCAALGDSNVSLDLASQGIGRHCLSPARRKPLTFDLSPPGAANALLCIREDILDFIVGFKRFNQGRQLFDVDIFKRKQGSRGPFLAFLLESP